MRGADLLETSRSFGLDPEFVRGLHSLRELTGRPGAASLMRGGDDARRSYLAAVQKATVDTGVAAGGLLSPEQSTAFVRTIKDKAVLSSRMRLVQRRAASGEINKLTSGGRLIREATENADDGYRAEVQFPTVPYAAKKIRLPWEVTEDVFHENIEQEALEAEIVDEMTQQFALDWEDLNVNGSDASGDPFLGIDDGLLQILSTSLAGSHRINATSLPATTIAKEAFFSALKAMPNKYINQGNLAFLGSPVQTIAWVEYLTARNTAAGDAALFGGGQANRPLNIEFIGVPSFPDNRLVLTPPSNLTRVVTWDVRKRRVTGETDYELATRDKRGYIYFVKADFIVQELDAAVDVYGLTVAP